MKLRLISVVAAAGLLSGCAGLGFMNLAAVPLVAAFGAASYGIGSAGLGASSAVVAANSTLYDSRERYGNPGVHGVPVVVTRDLAAYGEATTDNFGVVNGIDTGVYIVGHYETYNEVLIGKVQRILTDDSEVVVLTLRNTGVDCTGSLYPPDDGWPIEVPLAVRNCYNRIARGELSCSDGRKLVMDWRATQCRVAYGTGFDDDGGMIHFSVLNDKDQVVRRLDNLVAQVSPLPQLPAPRQL